MHSDANSITICLIKETHMTHRALMFVALFIASVASAFSQGTPAGQAPAEGQRGQRTFTTNGNGGIVDAPPANAQRGQRGPARPAAPAPRGPNGRALLS